MRITLSIALGAAFLSQETEASFPFNCGPCIPMMPCPCPSAGYPMMQAPPTIMFQALPVREAAVRPCTTPAPQTEGPIGTSTASITSSFLSTGDISSVIKEIIRAELTGKWTELMEAISQLNTQTGASSVTHNHYAQHNRFDVSTTLMSFIQTLITRLEQDPARSPQDDRNLAVLVRLRENPPAAIDQPRRSRPRLPDLVRMTDGLGAPGEAIILPGVPPMGRPAWIRQPDRIDEPDDDAAVGNVPRLHYPALPPDEVVVVGGGAITTRGGRRFKQGKPTRGAGIVMLPPQVVPVSLQTPLDFVPPLALGWTPTESDSLIPAYSTDVQRLFSPQDNTLVRYLANVFKELCVSAQDRNCLSGAEPLARLLISLNHFTDGYGTSKLPNPVGPDDWITIGGSAANDPYIRLLTQSLSKYRDSFCLGEAGPRCDAIKPQLLKYLSTMLEAKTDFGAYIRSFVIISLTNGFRALTWADVMDKFGKPASGNLLTSGQDTPVVPALTVEQPRLLEDIKRDAQTIMAKYGPVEPPGPTAGDAGPVDEKMQKLVHEMIRRLVFNIPSEIYPKFPIGQQIILRIADTANVEVDPEILEEQRRDNEARKLAQQVAALGDKERDTIAAGAGTATRGPTTISGSTTDIVVAGPAPGQDSRTPATWEKSYQLVLTDDATETEGGQEPKLVIQRGLSFAPFVAEFLKKGQKLVLPTSEGFHRAMRSGRRGASQEEGQLIVYGTGSSEIVAANGPSSAGSAAAGQGMDPNTQVLYNLLEAGFKMNLCSVNNELCVESARALAEIIARIDTATESKGTGSLPSMSDDGKIVNISIQWNGDEKFNQKIQESISKAWTLLLKNIDEQALSALLVKASKLLQVVSNHPSFEAMRAPIVNMMTKGVQEAFRLVSSSKSQEIAPGGVDADSRTAITDTPADAFDPKTLLETGKLEKLFGIDDRTLKAVKQAGRSWNRIGRLTDEKRPRRTYEPSESMESEDPYDVNPRTLVLDRAGPQAQDAGPNRLMQQEAMRRQMYGSAPRAVPRPFRWGEMLPAQQAPSSLVQYGQGRQVDPRSHGSLTQPSSRYGHRRDGR